MMTTINIYFGSVCRFECQLISVNPTGPLDVKIWSLMLFMNVGSFK